MADAYQLARFVEAQDLNGMYTNAVSELQDGAKRGHWMWFIFPQIAGLGYSAMSRKFAISSLPEAEAYLQHPVLGPRLINCAQILMTIPDKSAVDILGVIDAMKLQSSMTLFMTAAREEPVFEEVLDKYFNGVPDQGTITKLRSAPS
jgi:uncharacterized protein (DUF1810 family)